MLSSLKRLFLLLNSSQKRRLYSLQILVLLMAFGEIAGVASIIPFMSLVGDMSQLDQNTFLAKVFEASGFESKSNFVFFTGIAVLLILLISALISMFTLWKMSMFAHKLGSEIADSLYVYYLKQDWLFHSSGSSAQLTKSISNETSRITGLILTPLLQMNARIGLALLMTLVLIIYDPKVAIVGILVFSIGYFVLYSFVRLRLHKNGEVISQVLEERFRLMNEGFGGVKDILLFGRDRNFIDLFNKSGNKLAYSYGTNSALSQVPRFLMELIAFGSMILLVLYLINNYDGDLGAILPRLSAYALAAFKLLPAFQQIYSNFALLKGHISAFDSVEEDLENVGAEDYHQLMRAWELKHRALTSQCVTEHTMFREETRWPGYYYRGDHMKLDDDNWHCLTVSRRDPKTGKFNMEKVPVYHIVDENEKKKEAS